MHVFRLHVRPGGGSASMTETFSYCIEHGLLGVGWRTKTNTNTMDWDTYYTEARSIHGNLSTCAYIKKWMKEGCLVWTRDPQGNYVLARVLAGWEYFTTRESIDKDIDIANIFRVSIHQIAIDAVPGKIVSCFRPARTIQLIADPTAILYSKFIWNQHSKAEIYPLDDALMQNPDIFSFLDPEEVEDIVFLYLQSLKWFVIPNSRKADTLAFEYQVINPESGVLAQVQIKTGNTRLDQNIYAGLSYKVILFQSNECYDGESQKNVTCLSRSAVENFLLTSISWLPERYRQKMALLEKR